MTAVNYSNITTLPYDTVFTIINTRSNITDPRDGTGARKFVWDGIPYHKGLDFSSFPYIAVELPIVEQVQAAINNEHRMMTYTQMVTVRTSKEGSGTTRTDAGHADMQQITDDMFQTFNANATKATMRTSGLFNSELVLINSDSITVSQKRVHESVFELSYRFRMKTVA